MNEDYRLITKGYSCIPLAYASSSISAMSVWTCWFCALNSLIRSRLAVVWLALDNLASSSLLPNHRSNTLEAFEVYAYGAAH